MALKSDDGSRKAVTWRGVAFLGLLSVGGILIVAGLMPKVSQAPVPDTYFGAADPDTYTPQSYGFEPSVQGPGVLVESIDLEAPLTSSDAEGGWLVLPDPPEATWFEGSVPIGSPTGSSVVASHVDYGRGDQAPFSRLHRVEKGAPVLVRGFDGVLHEYKAVSIALYERDEVPEEIFRVDGGPQLVLVTCSGPSIDAGSGSYYLYNLVVVAEPV